jgi:hypothetical protein
MIRVPTISIVSAAAPVTKTVPKSSARPSGSESGFAELFDPASFVTVAK